MLHETEEHFPIKKVRQDEREIVNDNKKLRSSKIHLESRLQIPTMANLHAGGFVLRLEVVGTRTTKKRRVG